ncbi:reverse transcriptase domain-containing protein [Tanacetum coccineum]
MSFMTGTLLDPFQIPYLKRKLTMEEMVNKFINEGRREHDEMEAFIKEFRTTNELLLKERNNSLCELGFELNIPFTEALAQMPKYAKFLKSLLSNKTRLEEACTVTMNERCSAVLLNKLPLKEKDPGSFTIPCDIGNLHIDNALADLRASISFDALLDNSDNLRKTVPSNLTTYDRRIQQKDNSQDQTIHLEAQELMENDHTDSFLLNNLDIDEADSEGRGERSDFKKLIHRIKISDMMYLVSQETHNFEKTWNEHLCSASANEINEKRPQLKDIPSHLEYAYLNGDRACPICQSLISDSCKKAFNDLKEKLTSAPIIISPNWNIPFELMCDASDFAVGAVLGQRIDGKFKPIYYASKTLNDAQAHYTTTEKELLAVYLFSKQDAKPRLIRWVLLLQGFDIEIKDKKGAENMAADHLSRLENPNMGILTEIEIADEFPDEHLMVLKTTPDNDEPWYADYVNYIVGKVIPPKWTSEKRKRFFSQVKYYFWDEPYAFRLCPDNIIKRCVASNEIR